jgi:hypothetical protein
MDGFGSCKWCPVSWSDVQSASNLKHSKLVGIILSETANKMLCCILSPASMVNEMRTRQHTRQPRQLLAALRSLGGSRSAVQQIVRLVVFACPINFSGFLGFSYSRIPRAFFIKAYWILPGRSIKSKSIKDNVYQSSTI